VWRHAVALSLKAYCSAIAHSPGCGRCSHSGIATYIGSRRFTPRRLVAETERQLAQLTPPRGESAGGESRPHG